MVCFERDGPGDVPVDNRLNHPPYAQRTTASLAREPWYRAGGAASSGARGGAVLTTLGRCEGGARRVSRECVNRDAPGGCAISPAGRPLKIKNATPILPYTTRRHPPAMALPRPAQRAVATATRSHPPPRRCYPGSMADRGESDEDSRARSARNRLLDPTRGHREVHPVPHRHHDGRSVSPRSDDRTTLIREHLRRPTC